MRDQFGQVPTIFSPPSPTPVPVRTAPGLPLALEEDAPIGALVVVEGAVAVVVADSVDGIDGVVGVVEGALSEIVAVGSSDVELGEVGEVGEGDAELHAHAIAAKSTNVTMRPRGIAAC